MTSIDLNICKLIRILSGETGEVVNNFWIAENLWQSVECRESNGYQLNKWDETDVEYQMTDVEMTREEKQELCHQLENLI